MDTLRGIPEHIEAEFGDSIVARDEAVALLGKAPGLGPPDLCWLQKAPKARSLLGGSAEAQGYYHFVLGRDVSSTAAVAAYFALLNSKVEPSGVLQVGDCKQCHRIVLKDAGFEPLMAACNQQDSQACSTCRHSTSNTPYAAGSMAG
jgi:hypothetical protein